MKDKTKKQMVVAVLRPRGHYEKYHKFDITTDSCDCPSSSYDKLIYEVGEIRRSNGTCYVVGYNDIVKIQDENNKTLWERPTELTMQEIADKFGINIQYLRIKS